MFLRKFDCAYPNIDIDRFEENGSELEQPLAIARDIKQLYDWGRSNKKCLEDSAINLLQLNKIKPKTKIKFINLQPTTFFNVCIQK